jgi:GNAT superfamily N-acetyltransferase
MSRETDPRPRWRMTEVRAPDRALLADLASLTRDSFAGGDMLPGLPAADGASDSAGSIQDELDRGIRMWMVHTGDARPVGCVRAIPRSDRLWQIRRLAVRADAQGFGLGRRLVRGLEHAARAEAVGALVVWALVERGIAPFYSLLGYRTTGHFGSEDKPLSEAIMELDLAAAAPALEYPWGTEPAGPGSSCDSGMAVSWFAAGEDTVAVLGALEPDNRSVVTEHHREAARLIGAARFIGGDGWAGCGREDADALRAELASRADSREGAALLFRRHFLAVREFTMPRSVHPELLALWRMPVSTGTGMGAGTGTAAQPAARSSVVGD